MTQGEIKRITLPIEGMHCTSCSVNIERSVGHVPGVIKANINFAASELTVEYDPYRVSLDKIKQAVAKPGYHVRESILEKTKTFWQEHGTFIHMTFTGLLVIASWALSNVSPFISNILAIIAVIVGGYPIYTGAARTILIPDLNVEVLITIAATASIFVGSYREAAMVILIMLIGETLEHAAVRKTRQAISKLMQLTPPTALVKRNGDEIEIPVENVTLNDIVIIKPGERIPVDGIITKGEGLLNQSMLTGESLPLAKIIEDKVYAGTVNESGSFEMTVIQIGDGTQIAHIKRLVQEAETEKAPIQRVADKFARYFIPIVILISVIVFLVSKNIYKSITVLVASCPCAMILATPTAVVAGLGNAARKGILIKGGQYLESFGHLKTLLMDKTGTLTQGKISVTDVIPVNHYQINEIVRFAAIAEKRSEHPIARAVLNYAKAKKLAVPDIDSFEIVKGMGVIVRASEEIVVGNRALMNKKQITIDPKSEQITESLEQTGKTVLLVAVNSVLIGLISVADILRPGIAGIINDIRKTGVKRIALLTGDNARTAQHIAQQAGITEWYSDLLPEDKIRKLREIKQSGEKTGMIGDGVNDAPALAAADVGIAMGVIGSDVAIEAADVSLMQDDISKIPVAIRLSKRVWNIIIQNFTFSICYNIAMITLIGLLVHDHSGITLGAILHQLSSLIVVGNSLRLLRG